MTAELASLLPSGDARHANRLSSLVGALPLSCELLKPQLAELVDRYWENTPMADLQALPAGLAFARYLDLEIRAGRVVNRFAIDVLRYERAWLELQLCTHTGSSRDGDELVRELAFEFDPGPLFEALGSGKPVPETLPDRPTTIDLDFRSDPPQTRFHHPVVKSPNDADQVNEMPWRSTALAGAAPGTRASASRMSATSAAKSFWSYHSTLASFGGGHA